MMIADAQTVLRDATEAIAGSELAGRQTAVDGAVWLVRQYLLAPHAFGVVEAANLASAGCVDFPGGEEGDDDDRGAIIAGRLLDMMFAVIDGETLDIVVEAGLAATEEAGVRSAFWKVEWS